MEDIDQDGARSIIADLPTDPSKLTDEQISQLSELMLSENHGVVSIVGEFIKELAREDTSELRPILPELLEVITHTDSIRRGDYVVALAEFDQALLNHHDPIRDWYDTVVDEEVETLERVKAAEALGALIVIYPESVRDITPDLLYYFAEQPIEDKQLGSGIGVALGRIAVTDEGASGEVVTQFKSMLRNGASLSQAKLYAVLEGLEQVVKENPDTVKASVDQLIELAGDNRLGDEISFTRANVLRTVQQFAAVDPELIRPHISELAALLTDENRFVRKRTAELFAEVGEETPSLVKPVLDDLVAACTDEDADARHKSLRALAPFEEKQAAGAKKAAPLFVEEVADTSEDGYTNRDSSAAYGLSTCAEEFPETVIPMLAEFIPALGSPSSNIRSGIAGTVGELGQHRPDAVRHVVEPGVAGEVTPASAVPLVRRLDDDVDFVSGAAARAIGKLTAGDPSLFKYTREPLVERALKDDAWQVEESAVRALGKIGAADPSAVKDLVPAIIRRLGDKNSSVRAAACEALGKIGETNPDTVSAAEQPLIDRLTDHVAWVRAAACKALGQIGVERAGPEIRSVTEDPEEEARTAADEALNALGLPKDGPLPSVETGSEEPELPVGDSSEANTSVSDGAMTVSSGEKSNSAAAQVPDPASVSTPVDLTLNYQEFERQERLGRGATAEVYRATVETDDGRMELAIKEPITDGTIVSETFDRFQKEVSVWERICDRPGIVSVVDWGEKPIPWIAMEYMDGGTLSERIDDVGVTEALWISEWVANSIRHDRTGVQHLDLKPSNVLFRETSGDQWDLPKVADWGLARMIAETSASSDGFTVTYAAPEQFNPDTYGRTDARTDIYQLGALTYELIAGEPPFTGPNHKIMHGVLNEQPDPVSGHNPEVPAELDDVIGRALKKQKDDRYETAERFYAALQSVSIRL